MNKSQTRLSDRHCRFCQQPLADSIANSLSVCEQIDCKLKQQQQVLQHEKNSREQREQYRQGQQKTLIDSSCKALDISPEELQLVSIPYNPNQATTLDYAVIEEFEQHLQQLVEYYSGEDESDHVTDFLAPDDIDELSDALVTACTACRGHCCFNGREYFAFIEESTISRVISQQEIELDAVTELYLSYIPSQTIEGGCVYQAENGCCLPDELRADICGQYFCSGLRDFIESADSTTTEQTVLAVWKNDDIIDHLYLEQ
ncbi:hypothetical protein SIN8267_01877 [Sinobacterium norvegicum]|uniref:Uncharacterized protein n=1 Tax=Sinobacterium norvegicum TaxID=1641715 RepID=A0ABM9AEZ4_9GAMM|nr:hypothetical protein [Sinobacterium norvegicum]CAH0991763.1 hypothetical protein SIN8267_01877 [Sinobacterium norvegicum]